jgi:hypothetical protein
MAVVLVDIIKVKTQFEHLLYCISKIGNKVHCKNARGSFPLLLCSGGVECGARGLLRLLHESR